MRTTFVFMRGVERGMSGRGNQNPYEQVGAKAEWNRGYRLGAEYLAMKNGYGVVRELELKEVPHEAD